MSDPLDRIEEAFESAVHLEEEERRAFLLGLSTSDPDLASEVNALLAADSEAGDFLDRPVVSSSALPTVTAGARPEERIGEVLGGYTLVRLIGTGGMSFVYLGEKQGEGFVLNAAVKVIRADVGSDELAWRFVRERRLLASLRHPNIARLLDGGTTPDGCPWLVMEYVHGLPMDRHCREHGLSVPARLRLFRDICDAVACAHRALVVHRDLKPSNILVTTEGTPKLLDFGIAKLLGETDEERMGGGISRDDGITRDDGRVPRAPDADATIAGMRLLTPRYASPEQVRGEPTTTATDVYALGVLLYELLTGRSPYEADIGSDALERLIVSQPPTRPSQAVNERAVAAKVRGRYLEGDLDHIVLRALEKAPEARYSSVELLANDIDRHLRGLPVSAHPDSLRYRLTKFARRNSALVGLTGLLVILLAVFAVSTAIQLRTTAAERDRAHREAEIAGQTAAFLENLFRVADPSESRGETVTAREILDRGAATARTTLGDEPGLQARFLRSLGRVHASLGLYARADSLLKESVDLYRRNDVGDPSEIATTLDQRAFVAKQQGRIPDAIDLATEALSLRESSIGPDALPTAQSLNNLALLHRRMNELDTAAALFERAARIRERELGPNHPDAAGTLQNMGNLYGAQGRLDDAKVAYQRALDARLASGESDSPAVAAAYSGLASVAIEQGRFADAESLQVLALGIKTKLYGETHDAVAAAWTNLALVRKNAGKLEAAREAALHSADLFEKTLGPGHQHRGSALFTLGQIEMDMGDNTAALARVEEAHRIFLDTLPPGHPDIEDAAELLADLYRSTGRTPPKSRRE